MLKNSAIKDEVALRLLAWYDVYGRDLAWRVHPSMAEKGARANPYHVWLSEIMLQQTTVVVVTPYFQKFMQKWPTLQAFAEAPESEIMAAWAGLGYYARARNMIKSARIIMGEYGGVFPNKYEDLIKLPGIGAYTGAAIASIAFGTAQTVVDGNVERIMARLFAHKTPLPSAKKQLYQFAKMLTPQMRSGDYAQAMMDLGAMVCRAKIAECDKCPLGDLCLARKEKCATDLPLRLPKIPKPTRYAHFFVARRADGAWLLERRAQKGLLGGMLGWPSGQWEKKWPSFPDRLIWQQLAGEIRHTFTHFHLIGKVFYNKIFDIPPFPQGEYFYIVDDEFNPNALPSLMRKAYWRVVAKR